ncbi:hypothetical protein [Geomicrobium sediminis]|uniref:Uncharacterized protein n=1 Tax=Geomicrobium sediminis TaxID=1347788 RepID=A0ABS2PIU3_9BACL|nr:hypothetical protein [Geomicrobium sediminis]MBM7634945.1 hypothetical protein [Geomicrobium sediminis]
MTIEQSKAFLKSIQSTNQGGLYKAPTPKIEKAVEAYQKTREIKDTSMGKTRILLDMYKESEGKINANGDLSEEGRRKKISELKQELSGQFLKQARKDKKEVMAKHAEIHDLSRQILVQKPSKPDDTTLELHNQKLEKIKRDAKFSSAQAVIQRLKEFSRDITDPYLAQDALEQADAVVSSINLDPANRVEVGKIYHGLESISHTEDKQKAEELLQFIGSPGNNPRMYGSIEENALTQQFGHGLVAELNKPVSHEGDQ